MEYNYKIGQRMDKAPVIRRLGAIRAGMEQTPFVFGDRLMLAESASESDGKGQERPYFRIVDLAAGKLYPPFAYGCYFCSAYCENGVVYAFGTTANDALPLTMYQSQDASQWHDPRGGDTVMMFSSSDLEHWEKREALKIPHRRLWNTSVCRGKTADGQDIYMMAIEESARTDPDPAVGVPFTCFFASSPDLVNWTPLDDLHSYTSSRYNACPALRYCGGWYYMICLEALPAVRYAPYIYRTKDFADWYIAPHNPIMMYGDEDRVPAPGAVFTPQQLDQLENGININLSDVDLCEYHGKTYLFYANGDQMTWSMMCEAVCDSPMDRFLEAFFN